MTSANCEDRPVALITGGSAGVGRAMALRSLREGWDIFICGRDRQRLDEVAAGACQPGLPGSCETLAIDLAADPIGSARTLVQRVTERFGRLDLLVNNAGNAPMGPVAEFSDQRFAETVAVHITAPFALTRACWPLLSQDGGVIVNISSLASLDPFAGFAVYGGCKAWINTFTKALAQEGQARKIRAYAIALGAVETGLLRTVLPDFPRQEALDPDEVAAFLLTLLDPAMGPASGQTLVCKR